MTDKLNNCENCSAPTEDRFCCKTCMFRFYRDRADALAAERDNEHKVFDVFIYPNAKKAD